MVQVNNELDTQRKREIRLVIDFSKKYKSPQKIAEYQETLDGIIYRKYALLKNENSLKKKLKSQLMSV
jgi:transposase